MRRWDVHGVIDAELTATVQSRELLGLADSWEHLIAVATATQGEFQEWPSERVADLYKLPESKNLLAAAQIFDQASQHIPDVDEQDHLDLSIDALVTYGMVGNFVSAAAVAKRVPRLPSSDYPVLPAILTCCAPSLLSEYEAWEDLIEPTRSFLSTFKEFSTSGSNKLWEKLRSLLRSLAANYATDYELALIRSSQIALMHCLTLSVARNLVVHGHRLDTDFIDNLTKKGIRFFLPSQYLALSEPDFLGSRRNVVATLPPSAGKTLLGELLIACELGQEPGISFFVTPYVALGNQTATALRQHLPNSVRVHSMFGGFQQPLDLDPHRFQEVVVATPERFDALLRNRRDFITQFRCVVFDEVHTIGNDTRGVLLEGLIARLRLINQRASGIRLALLSAVVSNPKDLLAWLGDDAMLVSDQWRPTARRLATWRKDGLLRYYYPPELQAPVAGQDPPVLGYRRINWPKPRIRPTSDFRFIKSTTEDYLENIAFLVQYLRQRAEGAILLVCATKGMTRQVASRIAADYDREEPIAPRTQRLILDIQRRYPHLLHLTEFIARGITYHNASLPRDVKLAIEAHTRNKSIDVVVSTTTLAEGVDLPFRYTVLVDWLYWTSRGQEPINQSLFKNIAGRCGRAGHFTEGDVIVVDNPIGPLTYTEEAVRHEHQRKSILAPPSADLSSAVEEHPDDKRIASALASQIVAAIPENPEVTNMEEQFTGALFSGNKARPLGDVTHLVHRSILNLLNAEDEALAVRNSPLRLTAFGEACNRTGFSPDSCRVIRTALARISTRGSFDLPNLVAALLEELYVLPEQSTERVRKVFNSPRSRVKKGDLGEVLRRWTQGVAEQTIFAGLPALKRSKITPDVDVWANGLEARHRWDEEFDQFTEVMSGITSYVPWLLRACEHIAPFAEMKEIPPFALWADFVERGVDSEWAVAAIAAEAPAPRAFIASVGRLWPDELKLVSDPLGLSFMKNGVNIAVADDVFDAAAALEPDILAPEAVNLSEWYFKLAGL